MPGLRCAGRPKPRSPPARASTPSSPPFAASMPAARPRRPAPGRCAGGAPSAAGWPARP